MHQTVKWDFRKILQSTESYRAGSPRFMAMIQKGTPGALQTIVREISIIMQDPRGNIFSKVLAMRFARDIMILGRKDVIKELTTIVPHMLQVCSYRLESDDPNRGQTFFNNHPDYKKSDADVMEKYGSTYFILNLQSIYHWGNWIKVDDNGNQSTYAKALNTLLERGVKFPTHFNYYKNSDAQKFHNTYRVEFFSQESMNTDSALYSESEKLARDLQHSFQPRQPQSVEEVKNALRLIGRERESSRKLDDILQMKKSAIALLERKYHPSMIYYGKEKVDKKWLEDFIINNNLLAERKIGVDQMLKRSDSETIELQQKVQIHQSPSQSRQVKNGFKKPNTSVKRQLLSKTPEDKMGYEQLIRQQQETHQEIVNRYKLEIQELHDRIHQDKIKYEFQKNNIIQAYEDRIKNIKQEAGSTNSGKIENFIKENEKLKDKLLDIEKSMAISRSRQAQANNAVVALDSLKNENQNLKKLLNRRVDQGLSQEDRQQLTDKIRRLEGQLRMARDQNQVILTKMPGQKDLAKKDKQIVQLNEELTLYKSSLKNERQKFAKKNQELQHRLRQFEDQIKLLQQKCKTTQKKLDLRDIEAVQLTEQMKLFRTLASEQKFTKSRTIMKDATSEKASRINSYDNELTVLNEKPQNRQQKGTTTYDFKKYQQFRNNSFRNEKERYLRFCRCSLKKKDLLLKQNQLQIGLISQPISNNEVKYIIHLTNMSQSQMNQIHINPEATNPMDQVRLQTQYIFCLQTNQQEKINLQCRSTNNFISKTFDPIFLVISYLKNERSCEIRVVIPFVLFKTLELYKVDRNLQTDLHKQYTLTFSYSHKMISETKHLYSYFPPLEETSKNKFEVDGLYRETGSRFRIEMQLKEGKMTLVISPIGQTRADPKQQQMIQYDLISFLEFCFRK